MYPILRFGRFLTFGSEDTRAIIVTGGKLLEVAKKEIVELQGANRQQQMEHAVNIAWLERRVKSLTASNKSLRRSAINLEVLAEANQGV